MVNARRWKNNEKNKKAQNNYVYINLHYRINGVLQLNLYLNHVHFCLYVFQCCSLINSFCLKKGVLWNVVFVNKFIWVISYRNILSAKVHKQITIPYILIIFYMPLMLVTSISIHSIVLLINILKYPPYKSTYKGLLQIKLGYLINICIPVFTSFELLALLDFGSFGNRLIKQNAQSLS